MNNTTAATQAALDVDSIKEIMDSFDPAVLLPEMDSVLSFVVDVCRWAVLIGPVLLIGLGIIYLFLAPKEANHYLGFRCYFGMGSVQAWRYTQRIAGLGFTALGLVLLVVMWMQTLGFSAMAPMDVVFRALTCLIWQAVLSLLLVLGIHGLAMFFFDSKGEPRRRPTRSAK